MVGELAIELVNSKRWLGYILHRCNAKNQRKGKLTAFMSRYLTVTRNYIYLNKLVQYLPQELIFWF